MNGSGVYDQSSFLFLPSWWVRAYESSCHQQFQKSDPFFVSEQTNLVPALTTDELNALAVIMANLQVQILQRVRVDNGQAESTDELMLELNVSKLKKHCTLNTAQKLWRYQRFIQSLSSVQFLVKGSDTQYQVLPFISKHLWSKQNDGFSIKVALTDQSEELVLGYTDPYLELMRFVEKVEQVSPLLGSNAPLGFSRSVWHELGGIDQLLYLRMEKALQWQFRWLHLDGVFGVSLSELFEGFVSKAAEEQQRGLNFYERQNILEKLAKKLCDHGVILSQRDSEFFAISEKEQKGVHLTWQFNKDRLLSQDHEHYQMRVIHNLVVKKFTYHLKMIIKILSGSIFTPYLSMQWETLWHQLLSTVDWQSLCKPVLYPNSSSSLCPLTLYLEYCIRSTPGHQLPLPPELVDSNLATTLTYKGDGSLIPKFESFIRIFSEKSEILKFIKTEPLSTIANPGIRSKDVFINFIEQARAMQNNKIDKNTAVPQIGIKTKADVLNVPAALSASKAHLLPETKKKIRRIATDELNRMRLKDFKLYEQLKINYFNALDPSKRKLLNEVQQRMQPELFEDHLRYSLINFMVENPGSWHLQQMQVKA